MLAALTRGLGGWRKKLFSQNQFARLGLAQLVIVAVVADDRLAIGTQQGLAVDHAGGLRAYGCGERLVRRCKRLFHVR